MWKHSDLLGLKCRSSPSSKAKMDLGDSPTRPLLPGLHNENVLVIDPCHPGGSESL